MKKILILTLIAFGFFNASAQNPTWQKIFGNQRFETALGIPVRDTITRGINDTSNIVIRPQDGLLYYRRNGAWTKASAPNDYVTINTAQTVTGYKIFDPTLTASGKMARSLLIKGLLTAAADSDTLVGLDIQPTFNLNSKASVQRRWLRVGGNYNDSSFSFIKLHNNGVGSNTGASIEWPFGQRIQAIYSPDGFRFYNKNGTDYWSATANSITWNSSPTLSAGGSNSELTIKAEIGTSSKIIHSVGGYHSFKVYTAPATFTEMVRINSSGLNAYGFAGYNANRSSSYTARSFVTKNDMDSANALRVSGNSVRNRVAYWGGANQITGNSAFIWDTATLRLGIGTAAAPLAPIHVGNQNYNSSVDAQILISRTIANERTGNAHSFSDASRFVRAGGVAFNSFDARIEIAGANNYDHYVAFQHAPSNNATGTITYMSGLSSLLYQNAGTITHNSAVYVMNPFGVGAITNNYGMLIEPLTRGTNNFGVHSSVAAGNRRWNFYAAGTARNLFTGITHIGDTTTYDGSPNLSVTGKAWISDSLRAGVTTIGNLSSTGVQRFNRGTLTFLINPSFGGANNYSQLQASSTLTIATGGDFNRLAIDGTHGNVAIGSVVTSFDDRLLSITKPFVGSATTRYGIYQNNTVNSNLSNVAINNSSLLTTQAASFNLTHAWHYDAAGISRGAGSTITNQYGFYARDFSEATNNMGFVGMLSSGANKWNFYASGTANNYFNGNTLIGTLSNPDNYKLIVSGGSTFGAFVSSSNYRLNAPNLGNWDIRYGFFGSGGTDRGGFGGYGSSDSLKSYYIGASYSDAIVRFDSAIKKTDFFGRVVGTSDAVFTGGGVTAQRGNFTSLRLNKDSVSRTTTNTQVLTIDTTSGNVNRLTIQSGIYLPVAANVSNTSAITVDTAQFMRVGNVVTVSGRIAFTNTLNSPSQISITLPVATVVSSVRNVAGVGNENIAMKSAIIRGRTGTNDALLEVDGLNSSTYTIYYTYTYRIL